MRCDSLRVSGFLFLATVLVACAGDPSATPDGKVGSTDAQQQVDGGVPALDQAPITPDSAKLTSLKVAGVQYSSGNYTAKPACASEPEGKRDVCGVSKFVKEAAANGAKIVVTPEAVLDQDRAEATPSQGDNALSDARWPEGTLIRHFAKLAEELKITVVFQLITQRGEGTAAKLYNTSVAVAADGRVMARHLKFQLFGNEGEYYTPGESVEQSFFDTPAGRAGLMICADAQCIITGMNPSPDCTTHSIAKLKEYFTNNPKRADVIFFSAFWTVGPENPRWAAMEVQYQVAKNGAAWLVAANNTKGNGKGGGIYKPDGSKLVEHVSVAPGIIYGELPLKQ